MAIESKNRDSRILNFDVVLLIYFGTAVWSKNRPALGTTTLVDFSRIWPTVVKGAGGKYALTNVEFQWTISKMHI